VIQRSQLAAVALLGAGACTVPTVGTGTFFLCPDSGAYCTASGQLALDGGSDGGPADAGRDAGQDAGLDAGPDGGLDAGPDGGSSAGCIIAGTGTLPDLLYPRWGLGGAYIVYNQNGSHDRIFAAGGYDPDGGTTADVQGDELDQDDDWVQVGTVPGSNFLPRAQFPLVAEESIGLIAIGGIGGADPATQTVLGDLLILPYDAPPETTGVTWFTPDGGGPQLIQPRYAHAAVLAKPGLIITCGGSAQGAPTNSCEMLSLPDNVFGEWVEGPPMLSVREGLSMAVGSDGNVYAFSGSGGVGTANLTSFEMLNPNDLDAGWSCPGSCPAMTSGHVYGAAAVVGTKMFVMGGLQTPSSLTSINAVEYLDLANLSAGWQAGANMPQARSSFGAVVLPTTGTIEVFGGQGGMYDACTVASVEEYDPSNNTWQ
jgi:hypothetical protein